MSNFAALCLACHSVTRSTHNQSARTTPPVRASHEPSTNDSTSIVHVGFVWCVCVVCTNLIIASVRGFTLSFGVNNVF